MKTIFTLLSSLIMSAAVMAAPIDKEIRSQSTLTVRSTDRSNITVVIDGRRFEPNRSSMMVENIKPAVYQVVVYQEKSNGIFTKFGKRLEVVFNGSVSVRARTAVSISVDRFGQVYTSESRIKRGIDQQDIASTYDFERQGGFGDYDSHTGWGYKNAMSDRDFSNVLSSIQKEWFDNNKAKSASQIISTNYFTVSQVKQLLQLFTFESNKLDLAKQAYAKTVDQKNYFLINEAFTFDSSKDELARYIRNSR